MMLPLYSKTGQFVIPATVLFRIGEVSDYAWLKVCEGTRISLRQCDNSSVPFDPESDRLVCVITVASDRDFSNGFSALRSATGLLSLHPWSKGAVVVPLIALIPRLIKDPLGKDLQTN
jgi:hypothetical protein